MNFVLNIDPDADPVAVADVKLRSECNYGEAKGVDAVYIEFRHDSGSRRSFVCLVYRLPEVER